MERFIDIDHELARAAEDEELDATARASIGVLIRARHELASAAYGDLEVLDAIESARRRTADGATVAHAVARALRSRAGHYMRSR